MAGGAKKADTVFWKLLQQVSNGPNQLGTINQIGERLQGEMDGTFRKDGELCFNTKGRLIVRARALGGGVKGFVLEATEDGGIDCEDVYWLPWKNHAATSAKRKSYENDCKFFMTTSLTGCRFTLTENEVLHVANSPDNWSYDRSSDARSRVEEGIVGSGRPNVKRVDPTGGANAHGYGEHRTLVFGMRMGPKWVYKMLETSPLPGNWTIL